MKLNGITRAVGESALLEPHSEYIHGLVRQAFSIQFLRGPRKSTGSRFGGRPAAPNGFKWPTSDTGWYRFLGQLNFAEIPETAGVPSRGLLTLFFREDSKGEAFWGEEGFLEVFFYDMPESLSEIDAPAAVMESSREFWGQEPISCDQLRLTPFADLPLAVDLVPGCPLEGPALMAYFELLESIAPRGGQVFGHPKGYSLGFEPTPGPDWVLLLSLASIEPFNWGWHGGETLMLFIERSRLANADFSSLKVLAG